MIKLVAFDWNGTLFNDSKFQFQGFNAALKFFNRKPISFTRFRETYDVPFSKMWTANGGHISEMLLQDKAYFEWYNKNAKKIPLKKNAKKTLKHLNTKNIPAIIFSNHPSKLIENDLKKLQIKPLVQKVLGRPPKDRYSHAFKRSKHKRLQLYLQAKKIKPEQVLCVGDTIEEIELSKKLGFISVALTTGDCSTQRLKALNPDFVINDLEKITKIIEKLP